MILPDNYEEMKRNREIEADLLRKDITTSVWTKDVKKYVDNVMTEEQ